MSSQSNRLPTAKIVDMTRLRENTGRKKIYVCPEARDGATLLSIRQNLSHQATIGLRDIDHIRSCCSSELVDQFMANVRSLLDSEFGRLRVHRLREVFTIGHHCPESLISGLLRVQYYTRQVTLPLPAHTDSQSGECCPAVVWGIGSSVSEAEIQRLRRCRPSHS